MTSPVVSVTHFTDPACPFAFSAEPRLRRLEWLYGDALEWRTVLVVLSERPEDHEAKGFTPEKLAGGYRKLAEAHGMPIDWRPRDRVPVSIEACRDVVAAREVAPERAGALLRALRVLGMGGGLLDDTALRTRAATEAGIDPAALEARRADDGVEQALQADKAAARSPSPAARALDHKLGGPDDERRYTCPSLELDGNGNGKGNGASLSLPGFQPVEAYEVAVANLAPELEPRPAPASVGEVLEWAPFPLASAEVAAVCGIAMEDAHVELAAAGARFEPVGADGYWSSAA
jgi:2-hydroxychromene-2-carboxylate isomerase